MPNGVIAMSFAVPGLVETSTNLASVEFADGNRIVVTSSQRSSVESAKTYVMQMVESVFALAGADVAHSDGYPGWNPNPQSRLLEVTVDADERLFGTEPKVRAIHAGLECGLFLEKYPDLEMVFLRPDAPRRAFARRTAGDRHGPQVLESAVRNAEKSVTAASFFAMGCFPIRTGWLLTAFFSVVVSSIFPPPPSALR